MRYLIRLLKKSSCGVVIVARHCGVQKSTPRASLLDALHMELFKQPEKDIAEQRCAMSSKGSYNYLTCPMCDVEIPMAGDEKIGEQVFCPYCQTPLAVRKTKTDEIYLEEDF